MPNLPEKKVGVVACSGEELPLGTVARLAALKVLEELRPESTVTICLPLFLAGGEGDRAFARFYPTIAIDGCSRRCAAKGTERYSGKPGASLVVEEVITADTLLSIQGRRRLNEIGKQAVSQTAQLAAMFVDRLLPTPRNKEALPSAPSAAAQVPDNEAEASCLCATDLPVTVVNVAGAKVSIAGLPLILDQAYSQGKPPTAKTAQGIFEEIRIYNDLASVDANALIHELQQLYKAHLALQEQQK